MSDWMSQTSLLILFAIIVAGVVKSIGQNQAIGNVLLGFLIGPYVLGRFFPEFSAIFLFGSFDLMLRVLSELGLILIMFEVVWHSAARRTEGAATNKLSVLVVACMGVLFSFVAGFILAAVTKNLLAPSKDFWFYSLFCGVVFSLTAIPILVGVVNNVKNINQESVSMALSAAVYIDIFAWVSLSLLVASSTSSGSDVTEILIETLQLLLLVVFTVYCLKPMLSASEDIVSRKNESVVQVACALLICFAYSEIVTYLGFHYTIGPIIAAFAFLNLARFKRSWRRHIGRVSASVLSPIFFIYSGLQISFVEFAGSNTLWWLVLFVSVGTLAKVGGSYIGCKLCGLTNAVSAQVSVLLNTKGVIDLVILNIGLEVGVISLDMYSLLLLVAIILAVTPPFFLRLCNLLSYGVRKRHALK